MKILKIKIVLLFVVVFFGSNMVAFSKDYKSVDEKVKEYPSNFSKVKKIADLINSDFSSDDDKARAIYAWIAMNIKYDIKQLNRNKKQIKYSFSSEEERIRKEQEIVMDIATKTLKSKKGVCEGYSSLYKVLCDMTRVECEMIAGSTKSSEMDIGKLPEYSDHKWNAIKINGEWKLIDVTWGSGYGDSQTGKFVANYTDIYFFTNPDDFFLNHFPEEEKWLLTDKTAEDFAKLPYFYDYYLESGIELHEPINGLLNPSHDKYLNVIIDGEDVGIIEYTFDRGKSYNNAQPTIKNGKAIYKIKARGKYMTILIDNRAWAAFKIIL